MSGEAQGFTIAEKLRENAEAALYRGYRNADMQPVLLKSPHPGRLTTAELARLRHEYAILDSLSAPGVAKGLGIEQLGGSWALVMEYPGDKSLDHLVGPERLDLLTFLRTAIAMAESVEAVHRHHVIHRNVKPENFFRNGDTGKVTLIDFGAATRLVLEDRLGAQAGRLEGTLAYMSPEQTGRMNRSVDRRTDLYSLGVALYELAAGVLPFATTDPLELLHSHIARVPVPLQLMRSDWPRVVSDIIMRLLAKNAEDRYQDVSGFKADLVRCRDLLHETGTVPGFSLGEYDFSDELRIPQKLYGRERELATLVETLQRVCRGSAELLLIAGYSGVGKSVLVGELRKQTTAGVRFATGKSDAIARRVPYAPIIQACGELLRSILAEPPAVLKQWRQAIAAAIGNNGHVVTEILPELELVVGVQPAVEDLDPAQTQHRFESTFLAFVQVFASAEHPLVLFLDDIQWADAASLRMVQLLLTTFKQGHLLIIGAYRVNEVDATHLLSGVLDELRRSDADVQEIALRPLDEPAVEQWLAAALATQPSLAKPLAKIALRKTEGNPFFLGQFLSTLHRDGCITFDASSRQWSFSLREIEQSMVTDNVVDFMVGRLQRLPLETQALLQIASCIGYQFDRETLVLMAKRSAHEVRRALWHAIREGLVVPVDVGQAFLHEADAVIPDELLDGREDGGNPSYRFLHDRVHQAAHATLAERRRQEIHLALGRLRSSDDASGMDDRRLFDGVNHLNLGAGLIEDAAERRALAKLNLSAGRKAKDAAAHATAIRHLDVCLEMLGADALRVDYDTAFQAQLCRAECEIAMGQFDRALSVLDRLDDEVSDDLDRATTKALRILVFVSMNRMGDAIVVGIDAARILGMELATAPEAIGPAIGAEFGAIFATLGPRGFEALLDLPAMTDRRSLLLLHVLHRIMPAAAQVNPALMTLIVVRAVNLSLQKGNAPVSAYFCASFAHVQVVLGEPQKGYAIGQIAVRLNEMMSSQAIACAVHFVLGAFVAFWTADVSESVEHLRKGLKAALEVGDYLYACYCAMAQAVYAFQMGEPLEDVAEAVGSATELIERTGDATNRDVVGSLRRVVDRLRAATTPSTNPDDEALERRILERRNPFVISCHFQFLAIEKLLAEDRAGARACVQRARPGVPGNFNGPQDVFLEALYRAEQAHAGGTAAQDALAQLESSESTLRTWAAASPKSFGFRHALVAAELFSLRGNDAEALTAYEQAIALAREAGAIMFEALASELAGHYAERRGWSEVGRQYYLRNASVAYARWGAPKKARQLGVRVPEPRNRVGTSSVELPALDLVGDVRTGDFDAIALAKAAQALSGEIVLAKLMARLMEIAIEQAGAELGYLLLLRNGELWVEHAAGPSAKGFVPFRVSGADLSVAESSATSPMLPFARSVIDFVQHAREKVVLTHASEQHRFSSDPYLMQHRPQSLLCMPMVRQGELTGILYLENRLAADVFRPDQVNLLDMLSAQAAISLENARLYEEMEERVKDRTRKLEQSLRTIQDDQARIIEAERRAAVAHLESELAIAQRIQTSILPQDLSVVGTEIAAVMRTATEVGGDYYDLCPTEDGGFWLGIGDVSGHGLDAGLVMLMIQSSLASLMRSNAWGDPSQLLCVLNRAIYDNVRCRLGRDDYVTLSLFRFFPDGRFLVAGAHEDVLLWRARTGRCEAMQPQGTWIGMVERIEANTRTREGRLQDGDVMVLFTDGVVEARRQDQEQFGVERVMETVERFHADPANDMCRAILEQARAWSSERQDDQTVVIVRRGSRR